jgi:hypothetical protein
MSENMPTNLTLNASSGPYSKYSSRSKRSSIFNLSIAPICIQRRNIVVVTAARAGVPEEGYGVTELLLVIVFVRVVAEDIRILDLGLESRRLLTSSSDSPHGSLDVSHQTLSLRGVFANSRASAVPPVTLKEVID